MQQLPAVSEGARRLVIVGWVMWSLFGLYCAIGILMTSIDPRDLAAGNLEPSQSGWLLSLGALAFFLVGHLFADRPSGKLVAMMLAVFFVLGAHHAVSYQYKTYKEAWIMWLSGLALAAGVLTIRWIADGFGKRAQ